MSTYTASLTDLTPLYRKIGKTGPKLKFTLWHSGMYYVRRSNAWPHLLDYPDPPSYKDHS